MNDQVEQTEWCERVRAAIVAGNILEDPGHWRFHVEKCATCRPRVEGLLTLRRLMERASQEAPVREVTPEQGVRMMREVFERFHLRRRRQRMAGFFVVLLAAGAGTFAFTRPRGGAETARDPVAYAMELNGRIFPPSGRHDPELLRGDPELRAEYVRALDSPSSLVRRTALTALALSGVEVDAGHLETVIREWRETLDSPVELASTSDGEATIRAALAVRRTATLRAALLGALAQTGNVNARVPSTVLVELLPDADAEVRRVALMALANDPSFAPGDEVTSLFLRDPDVGVRTHAAECLIIRGGAGGSLAVVARLRAVRDDEVEASCVLLLGQGTDVLAFNRDRVESAATPIRLAQLHQRNLVRAGERVVPSTLVARALAGGPDEIDFLAGTAVEADWLELRGRLQTAWRARPLAERTGLGRLLARWDARSTDPARLHLALDIGEAQHDDRLREIVTALARSKIVEIRERAQALLRGWPAK